MTATLFDVAPMDGITRSAEFSPRRLYRYVLRREWASNRGSVLFIGLNPSTADEEQDDPTIRRCMRFARDWGYGSLWMGNLFAYRATDPNELLHRQPSCIIGPDNDLWLGRLARAASLVVAAWGAHPIARARSLTITRAIADLQVLGFTADGSPRHPLYMRADAPPQSWRPRHG